jgi:5-methylcytosine-specific restriction endonuclease McrA
LLVTPSQKNVHRFKDKVRVILHHRTRTDDPAAKMTALNRVLRGWRHYYRYVNAARITNQLDHWTFKTLLAWLAAHHGRGARWAWRQYVHQQGQRKNLAVRKPDGTLLFRQVMMDVPHRRYFIDWTRGNPYLTAQESPTAVLGPEQPLTGQEWEGATSKRSALKYEALVRDHYTCQVCGRQQDLEVHHLTRYRPQDKPDLNKLRTLCHKCHVAVHA